MQTSNDAVKFLTSIKSKKLEGSATAFCVPGYLRQKTKL